jgi:hypothetical protein
MMLILHQWQWLYQSNTRAHRSSICHCQSVAATSHRFGVGRKGLHIHDKEGMNARRQSAKEYEHNKIAKITESTTIISATH